MKKSLLLLILALAFLPTAAQKRVKVACVGNSITYGMTIPNRETDSYPAQLQRLLGPDYEVGNFGKSGATLLAKGHRPYIQQQEYQDALAFAGDIVVIHLGTNDTDPRNWPDFRDQFIADYYALMDAFRAVNPQCRFLIARLSPISHRHSRFESGTRDWLDQIQLCIEQIARGYGVQLIDFHEPLYAYPQLLPDALHPTAQGAARLARTVYEGITGDVGGLQLPALYTDNMVVQRGGPVRLHGKANAGMQVEVRLGTAQAVATADARGRWEVALEAPAVGEAVDLRVRCGDQERLIRNVVAGEVWLCSGQSNMAFPLRSAATGARDIPQARNPQIRLFNMQARWNTDNSAWPAEALEAVNQLEYFKPATWENCSPETVAGFSAVAYYFGKMLQDSLQVPVGLICNAVGGTGIESWVDRSTLEHRFPRILYDWTRNDFIQPWVRERSRVNMGPEAPALQRHPYEPCYLFESGILPLEQYPLRGVIWYQGESNAHNIQAHAQLFQLLVDGWRAWWGNPRLPFYYVQLSSLNRPSWPWFRDSQRLLLQGRPHLGMAVSSDCGDSLDVHPRAKEAVGQRLGRLALHHSYQYRHVCPSGPLFQEAQFRGDSAFVSFRYGYGLRTSDGEPPRTFELAGNDGLFYPAQARLTRHGVWLHSPQVPVPRVVRYGWQPFTRANLVNSEGLPASTFRSDTSL